MSLISDSFNICSSIAPYSSAWKYLLVFSFIICFILGLITKNPLLALILFAICLLLTFSLPMVVIF